jgi:hypothetical protein
MMVFLQAGDEQANAGLKKTTVEYFSAQAATTKRSI